MEKLKQQLEETTKLLKISEERLKNIDDVFDDYLDGIAIIDEKGAIIRANKTACRLMGFGGQGCHGEVFPYEAQLGKKEIIKIDTLKNSEPVFLQISKNKISWDGKNSFIVKIHDITELKWTEKKLIRTTAQWQATFNAIEDLVCLIDKDNRVVLANESMKNVFAGLPSCEGNHCYYLFHGACENPCMEECPARNAFRTGKLSHMEICEPHLDNRWFDVYAYPVFDEDGDVFQVVHVVRDITERKEAEKALKASEEQYRTLVENINVGIYRTEPGENGAILNFNTYLARLLRYDSSEEFAKLKVSDLYYNIEDRARLYELLNRRGYVKGFELALKRRDGSLSLVSCTARANLDDDGKIRWVEGVIEDITERKIAEKQLEEYRENLEALVAQRTAELQKMQEQLVASERLAVLGQFSGNVAHEIRNPLGVIGTSVFILSQRLKDADERVIRHIDKIREQVDSCASIIESILRLTRMEEPKLELVNALSCLRDGINSSKMPVKINVEWDVPPQPVFINVDQEQMRIAFKNLITNAIQAMPDGGTLRITLSRAIEDGQGKTKICFSDSGGGISKENIERIFQPLFTTKARGIGFGLSIVKMIVERHGGSMGVESGSGGGTTFTVTIPEPADAVAP